MPYEMEESIDFVAHLDQKDNEDLLTNEFKSLKTLVNYLDQV